jgi:hypothetical protein
VTDAPLPAHQHGTCLNCQTLLAGPFCHACGQHVLHAPRSLLELGAEVLEMLTHADGKFARTMRRLAFAPARLTRDYIEGRRASEIPPVRMFFVSLLIIFTLSSFTGPMNVAVAVNDKAKTTRADTHDHDEITHALAKLTWAGHPRVTAWLRAHVGSAVDDPREVEHVMGEWAERLVLLLLPITACVLWLLHAVPRPVPLFDHAIFALHSLTVAILALTVLTLVRTVLPDGAEGLAILAFAGVMATHLFVHMRGFYRAGVVATLVRMVLLAVVTAVVCLGLIMLLTLIGLQLGAD